MWKWEIILAQQPLSKHDQPISRRVWKFDELNPQCACQVMTFPTSRPFSSLMWLDYSSWIFHHHFDGNIIRRMGTYQVKIENHRLIWMIAGAVQWYEAILCRVQFGSAIGNMDFNVDWTIAVSRVAQWYDRCSKLTSAPSPLRSLVRFPVKPTPHVIGRATLSDRVDFLRGLQFLLHALQIAQYC
jgi:hypothetical protein